MAMDICPWWLGYLLASPVRRLFEDPNKLLAPHIATGATVLDVGSAMGFFTIPAARLTGENGRVIALDLQPRMISALRRRLTRRGLQDRVETRVCGQNDLGIDDLDGRIDLILAIHMVHEVPDRGRLFTQFYRALKPGGLVLLKEPPGHVTAEAFDATLATAEKAGFAVQPAVGASRGHIRILARS